MMSNPPISQNNTNIETAPKLPPAIPPNNNTKQDQRIKEELTTFPKDASFSPPPSIRTIESTGNTDVKLETGKQSIKKPARNGYEEVLQHLVLIALLSLPLLGLLSITQLICVTTILDMLILLKYENLQYSLLLLPLKIIDDFVVTKEYSASELKNKPDIDVPMINIRNIFGFLIVTAFALSWAVAQTILTTHFLPELIGYVGSILGVIAVPLLQLKIAVIVLATFLTIFLLGKNNLEHKVCENIIKYSANKRGQAIKIFFLGVMYFIIMGYSLEWVKYFALYMPGTLAIVVTFMASLTLARFLAKRVNATVDAIIISYYESGVSTTVMIARLLSYAAICALVFTALHIISFSLEVVTAASAVMVLAAIFEYRNSEVSIFRNLCDRFPLIVHGAGESLVSTSGIRAVVPEGLEFIVIPGYALILTVFEILADSNHNHVEDQGKYTLPNLKKLGIKEQYAKEAVKNTDVLKFLGYPEVDIVTNVISFGNQKISTGIIRIIAANKKDITITQAASLILICNESIKANDLVLAGFTKKEVIASKIFSGKHLEAVRIANPRWYKANITPIMLNKFTAQGDTISAEELKREKFSDEEIIASKIFSGKQLEYSGITKPEGYEAIITPFMLQHVDCKNSMRDLRGKDLSNDQIKESGIFSRVQLQKYGITVEDAYEKTPGENKSRSIEDLQEAGFTSDEIIKSEIFSKAQLKKANIAFTEDYKADLNIMISIYLSEKAEIEIQDLMTMLKKVNSLDEGAEKQFSDEEIIASKIFSVKQLKQANIQPPSNYKAKMTGVMLQCLAKEGEIKVEYLKNGDASFSEEEIIAGNALTEKQLLTLGLECDYYSSQLSLAVMLTLVSIVFINYNSILLLVGFSAIAYYIQELSYYDVDNKLKFSRLKNHFTYYASCITAFSLGVNGGMECLDVFGCGIYIAIALAIFGAVVEGSVYFDELMTNSDSHNHGNILDYIPSLENFVFYFTFCAVAAALYNVGILLNLPTSLALQIAIIVLPLAFKANYGEIHKKSKLLLDNTSGECLVATLITLANIVFSITTTLGYSILFMPSAIPVMVLCFNIALLALVVHQKPAPASKSILIGSLKGKAVCKCCVPSSEVVPSTLSKQSSASTKVATDVQKVKQSSATTKVETDGQIGDKIEESNNEVTPSISDSTLKESARDKYRTQELDIAISVNKNQSAGSFCQRTPSGELPKSICEKNFLISTGLDLKSESGTESGPTIESRSRSASDPEILIGSIGASSTMPSTPGASSTSTPGPSFFTSEYSPTSVSSTPFGRKKSFGIIIDRTPGTP